MFEPYSEETSLEQNYAPRKLDDRLYGNLLEVNAALKDAGGILVIVYALLLLFSYLALWFEWYRQFPALQGLDLNVVWVYLIDFVVLFFIWIAHFEFLQWWCYRRNRPELLDHIQRSAVSRYQLLAVTAQDAAVSMVVEALKRDRWDEPSHRYFAADVK